jgi:hypothetical protein
MSPPPPVGRAAPTIEEVAKRMTKRRVHGARCHARDRLSPLREGGEGSTPGPPLRSGPTWRGKHAEKAAQNRALRCVAPHVEGEAQHRAAPRGPESGRAHGRVLARIKDDALHAGPSSQGSGGSIPSVCGFQYRRVRASSGMVTWSSVSPCSSIAARRSASSWLAKARNLSADSMSTSAIRWRCAD